MSDESSKSLSTRSHLLLSKNEVASYLVLWFSSYKYSAIQKSVDSGPAQVQVLLTV